MDESFIYSLFVGMPASPCLLCSGCLAFGGSASDDLCCRPRARTGVLTQVSASPHKTCQSFASLTLFHPCQKAYPVRGPLAPNSAEVPFGYDTQSGDAAYTCSMEGAEFSHCATGQSQQNGRPCDGGVHLIPKSKPFGSRCSLVSCRHWATCECQNYQE